MSEERSDGGEWRYVFHQIIGTEKVVDKLGKIKVGVPLGRMWRLGCCGKGREFVSGICLGGMCWRNPVHFGRCGCGGICEGGAGLKRVFIGAYNGLIEKAVIAERVVSGHNG